MAKSAGIISPLCYRDRMADPSPASDVQAAPAQTVAPGLPRTGHPIAQLLFGISCVLALMFAADICFLLVTGKGAERRDFISYWAAGQQLAHHQDPYDPAATLRLERDLGFPPGGDALIVRNPPWALLLTAPLGYLSFRAAAVLWSLLLLACWFVSLHLLWGINGRPRQSFDIYGYAVSPTFVVALFAPALACIFYGQTALFALLGLTLFLCLHRSHPFHAGVSLWLCALKPHLFLPFAIVLLFWIIVTRSYKVLAGAVISLCLSSLATHSLDPSAWQQYARMMHNAGLDREFIPCVGMALRFSLNPGSMWLQYLPAVLGCAWAAAWYWTRRATWDWLRHGPLLVLVSLLVSPYSWLTDQALAAPALLLLAGRTSFRSLLALALASSLIVVAILSNLYMHSVFYVWTAPAWLAIYLLATRDSQ